MPASELPNNEEGDAMNYISTRGDGGSVSSAEAIKRGIAPDGGLYVPESRVKLEPAEIEGLKELDYGRRAVAILERFLTDYTREELDDSVSRAYAPAKFGGGPIAPVYKLSENAYILELWHGPTCAFKDMALQILPHLLVKAVKKTGETSEIVILVATSGDTGKAALEGFRDVEGTRLIVFFPENGVSLVQKLQMVTQEGSNVYSIGVDGNFDDAQSGVKAIFTDPSVIASMGEMGLKFSSANSINWGRLVPQIVYYFSSYSDLVAAGEIKAGEKINYAVPTGNFGNILAAYYAKSMGLPVNKLICASNENNVLTDFIRTGVYDRRRDFKRTSSPSMDILISSNLERLLFEITGRDAALVSGWMRKLKEEGMYSVTGEVRERLGELFWAGFTDEAETLEAIRDVYGDYGYVVDTHTAVGIDVYDKYVISTGDMTKTVVASTASPFKFSESVASAILGEAAVRGKNDLELLELLSDHCGLPVPQGLKDLDKKRVLHSTACGREEMESVVRGLLIPQGSSLL